MSRWQYRQIYKWVVALMVALWVLPAVALLEDAYQSDPGYQTAVRAVATAEDGVVKVGADPDHTAFALASAQEALAEARAVQPGAGDSDGQGGAGAGGCAERAGADEKSPQQSGSKRAWRSTRYK